MDHAPRTGLIVEVPEAEHAVAAHRLHLDATARLDVPAHVTVLFPFVAPSQVDSELLERLGALFAGTDRFEFALTHTDWFGTDVLWLAPEPDEPFRALTESISRAFPAHPPYGGEFADPIPHLTVGDRGALAHMQRAERAVRTHLPIESTTRSVTLMTESASGQWQRAATFALGPKAP